MASVINAGVLVRVGRLSYSENQGRSGPGRRQAVPEHARTDQPQDAKSASGDRRRLYGQNFFRSAPDARAFSAQFDFVAGRVTTIVEIGPGSGKITRSLAQTGLPIIAIEIDQHWSDRVSALKLPGVTVITDNFMEWEPEPEPTAFVGNLPFGTGTEMLRRCLEFGPAILRVGVLLLQREYVKKRVGHWGGNLFNSQWAPWFRFDEGLTFTREAFQPVPRADTSTLLVEPWSRSGLPWREHIAYQDLVRVVFDTGQPAIGGALRAVTGRSQPDWVRQSGLRSDDLVKDLTTDEWTELYIGRPSTSNTRDKARRTGHRRR